MPTEPTTIEQCPLCGSDERQSRNPIVKHAVEDEPVYEWCISEWHVGLS